MHPSAYDLKVLYNSPVGRMLKTILRARLSEFWPTESQKNMNMIGVGYAAPYLRPYMDAGADIQIIMPRGQGAHFWPPEGPNKVALSEDSALPFETNSVDRILCVHALEFMSDITPAFEEIWRVLKSNGRLILIVPNRMGLWARADWSPFGQGTPYSAAQLERSLRDHLFVHEKTSHALFVPPFKRDFLLRSAPTFEKVGRVVCPAMGGVHMIEASKQLYAGTGKLARASAKKSPAFAPVSASPSASRLKKFWG